MARRPVSPGPPRSGSPAVSSELVPRRAHAGRQAWKRPEHEASPASATWSVKSSLFPPLDAAAQAALARLPQALEHVRPLSGAHRRSLPEDIAALSHALTAARAELRRPYWSRPAFVSAYLQYFLPWNLVRLARLFQGLPLPLPGRGESPAFLLDAGSGPLTVPLALWLARPEWRSAPVHVLALDSAAQPLELGSALFEAWAKVLGEPVWPVRVEHAPLGSLAARALPLVRKSHGRIWLITAANVLNEMRPGRGTRGGASGHNPADGGTETARADLLEGRLERLLTAWSPLFVPGCPGAQAALCGTGDPEAPAAPALLFVEPGTRLGGTTLMRLRTLALAGGLSALAPCTGNAPCPLARGSWCHFTFSPEGAPRWLTELSIRAGLAKRSLSLSPLLLALAQEEPKGLTGLPVNRSPARQEARVLSSPFAVPGVRGLARYACTNCGLALLEDAGTLASGSLVCIGGNNIGSHSGERARRDAQSGARIFTPV